MCNVVQQGLMRCIRRSVPQKLGFSCMGPWVNFNCCLPRALALLVILFTLVCLLLVLGNHQRNAISPTHAARNLILTLYQYQNYVHIPKKSFKFSAIILCMFMITSSWSLRMVMQQHSTIKLKCHPFSFGSRSSFADLSSYHSHDSERMILKLIPST